MSAACRHPDCHHNATIRITWTGGELLVCDEHWEWGLRQAPTQHKAEVIRQDALFDVPEVKPKRGNLR